MSSLCHLCGAKITSTHRLRLHLKLRHPFALTGTTPFGFDATLRKYLEASTQPHQTGPWWKMRMANGLTTPAPIRRVCSILAEGLSAERSHVVFVDFANVPYFLEGWARLSSASGSFQPPASLRDRCRYDIDAVNASRLYFIVVKEPLSKRRAREHAFPHEFVAHLAETTGRVLVLDVPMMPEMGDLALTSLMARLTQEGVALANWQDNLPGKESTPTLDMNCLDDLRSCPFRVSLLTGDLKLAGALQRIYVPPGCVDTAPVVNFRHIRPLQRDCASSSEDAATMTLDTIFGHI